LKYSRRHQLLMMMAMAMAMAAMQDDDGDGTLPPSPFASFKNLHSSIDQSHSFGELRFLPMD
jgi:uncharacterized protein (DUF2141 family)